MLSSGLIPSEVFPDCHYKELHFTLDVRKTHYQCGRVPESTYVVASDHGVFSKVGVEMLNLIEMSIKVCFTEQRADLMCFQ